MCSDLQVAWWVGDFEAESCSAQPRTKGAFALLQKPRELSTSVDLRLNPASSMSDFAALPLPMPHQTWHEIINYVAHRWTPPALTRHFDQTTSKSVLCPNIWGLWFLMRNWRMFPPYQIINHFHSPSPNQHFQSPPAAVYSQQRSKQKFFLPSNCIWSVSSVNGW